MKKSTAFLYVTLLLFFSCSDNKAYEEKIRVHINFMSTEKVFKTFGLSELSERVKLHSDSKPNFYLTLKVNNQKQSIEYTVSEGTVGISQGEIKLEKLRSERFSWGGKAIGFRLHTNKNSNKQVYTNSFHSQARENYR